MSSLYCKLIGQQEKVASEQAGRLVDEPTMDHLREPLKRSSVLTSEGDTELHVPKCTVAWWGQVAVFNLLWILASTGVVLYLKQTVSAVNGEPAIFPFSFTFSTIQQPIAGVLALLLSRFVVDSERSPLPSLSWRETMMWLTLAVLLGVEIGLGNKAMQFLTVAQGVVLKATNVLFVMLVAFVWRLEALGCLRICAGLLTVSGGALQAFNVKSAGGGSPEDDGYGPWILGAGMMLASMLMSCNRWALAQWIFQVERARGTALGQMSKLQLLARALPVTSLVTLVLAVAFEPEAFSSMEILDPNLYWHALLVGLGLVTLLFAELNLVHRLSAVGFIVNATIHQLPIIMAGVVVDNNQVSALSIVGFAFCILGAFVYAMARYKELQKNIAPE